ncbi:MAG: DUF6880 family protein [Solirubrobacterales bacterium]
MSALARQLSERQLRRLAGERSFERGAEYLAAGRVTRRIRSGERVEASVQGTRPYRVELWVSDGQLVSSCTCPMGEGGMFCKHCVAVGLASLEPDEAGDPGTTRVTLDAVRDHLNSLPGEELVELLLEEAREDERLLDRLRLRVAAGDAGVNMAAFRDAIDRAVDPGGFVPYAEAYDYSRTLEEMIGSLQGLLDRGHAAEAVELVEYCCSAVEQAGGMVDDSDGHLGVALDRLQRLHREACERADLDPVQLAERLFERMMTSEYELFYDAIERYAPLLGAAGRRRYAELARAEWKQLPALRPRDSEDRDDRGGRFLITRDELEEGGRRFRITHVMELLAEQTGDVDELVAVISHDLSMPYSFLRIAQTYADAGRDDEAIEWAERGMEAFPDRPDSRLVTCLANAYRGREEHARAAELVWDLFEDHPGLASYQELKPYAERAGKWSETRDRALDVLRDRTAAAREERRRRGYGWSHYMDATELVRIRLWEGDVEAALREARAGGCSQDVWLTLAERLDDTQPEEALAIYRDQVEPTINRKTKADYQDATELLTRIRELMARIGHADEFPAYLEEVRAAHRRKRNLMKLLDDLEES